MTHRPNHNFFDYGPARLHYDVMGSGPHVLLAFHGFGQGYHYFQPFAQAVSEQYTIYSFDLFYHGGSFWHDGDTPLTPAFWKELLTHFLRQNNIDRFGVTGFSLGGKFVLATLSSFPHRINEVLFIAPDGIKTSFWYSLATYPGWFRDMFRSLIVNPGPYYKLVKAMRKLNLIDKGVLRFASHQMDTRRKRRQVYYAWMVFRELQFDTRRIAALINKHNIRVRMFLGRYDKIITEKNMQRLLKHLKQYDLHILEAGHNTLIADVAEFLKKEN
ncbi:alpha/beta fold hydrolase [Roseivirga sp. BDSF3-8]|uniref:alpha/beta fold hydrolase n=1 Tax=Roseivirga sp. BDSF3-8 TaxID=3241598 RepID=UPI003531E194